MQNSKKIYSAATQILEENYNHSDKSLSFGEWVINEIESDPKFYNWLLPDADNINDFGSGMNLEQKEAVQLFLNTL